MRARSSGDCFIGISELYLCRLDADHGRLDIDGARYDVVADQPRGKIIV